MRTTERNEELTENCEYEILNSSATVKDAYWANEQNKINKKACDEKWEQIRSPE